MLFFKATPKVLTPLCSKLFRLDVMTPHCQPYYEKSEKNPPANDWYDPVSALSYILLCACKQGFQFSKNCY